MSEHALRCLQKWTGLLVCAVILSAFVVSHWFWLDLGLAIGNQYISILVKSGHVLADSVDVNKLELLAWPGEKVANPPPLAVVAGFLPAPLRDWTLHAPSVDGALQAPYCWKASVPLWLPLLAMLLPTLLLWRLDRRRRPLLGHCKKCDYNLTGNTSGICPECGTPIAAGPGPTS